MLKFAVPSFIITSILLLGLITSITPEKERITGQVFIANPSPTGITPNVPLIMFKKKNHYYVIQNETLSLVNLQGESIVFDIEPGMIDSTSPTFSINDRNVHLILSPVEIVRDPINSFNFTWGWAQILISIFSSAVCIFLWVSQSWRLRESTIDSWEYQRRMNDDFGIFYLAGALLLWGLIGVLRIYTHEPDNMTLTSQILSIINNMFFLLSFPHFKYGIKWIHENKFKYHISVLIVFILGLFVILGNVNNIFSRWIGADTSKQFAAWVDVIITISTSVVLGWLLINSFIQRKLYAIAWLAGVWVLGDVLGQSGTISPGLVSRMGYWWNVNYIVCFINLNILITALIFSWYSEEQSQHAVEENEIKKILEEIKNAGNNKNLIQRLFIQLIDRNEFGITLRELQKMLSEGFFANQEELNIVVNLSSRFNNHSKQFRTRTTSKEELDIELNRIRMGLIEVIKRVFPNE